MTPTPALPEEYEQLADALVARATRRADRTAARAALDAYVAGLIASPRSGAGEPETDDSWWTPERVRDLRAAVNDTAFDCDPACNSDGHTDTCYRRNEPSYMLARQQAEVVELTARLQQSEERAADLAHAVDTLKRRATSEEGARG